MRVSRQIFTANADHLKKFLGSSRYFFFVGHAVRLHRVGDLIGDAHHGVQRIHAGLEDHRELFPARLAQYLEWHSYEFLTV